MEILDLVTVPNWLIYTVVFTSGAYIYYTWNYGFFSKLGIPGPKPVPIFGSMNLFFEHGFVDIDKVLVEKYGKLVGMYAGRDARFVIGDVNMLRQILIKDFPTFQDRGPIPLRGILKRSLVDSKGEVWKNLRHMLTPAFTSGKLKQMMGLIQICGNRFVANIDEKCKHNEEFEAKEYCGAFTMDVIASSAFGLQVDAQKNKDDPFIHHAMKLLAFDVFNPWLLLTVFTPFLVPVLEWFGVHSMPNDSIEFFTKVVKDTLKDRRQGNGIRVDILQMMLDSERHLQEKDEETKEDLSITRGPTIHKKHTELTEDDIVAQSLVFFLAGYDTTANTMAFLLYELAINQEVQDKLYTEIDDIIGHKEPVHDDLNKLPYLEMCINETLRMYPPLSSIDRLSNQDFEYNGMKIPKGTIVVAPVKALHFDPEVWPEPQKFDPERFSADAKASRDSMYYMPFGMGPRNCIGMRLALLEMKLTLVKLFRQYRIVPCEKTEIPLKLKKTFLATAENGIWVKAELRS